MVSPQAYNCSLRETRYPEDGPNAEDNPLTFFEYSASGDVTAEVVSFVSSSWSLSLRNLQLGVREFRHDRGLCLS